MAPKSESVIYPIYVKRSCVSISFWPHYFPSIIARIPRNFPKSRLVSVFPVSHHPFLRVTHVHLSPDRDTAHKVGSRHGKPAILQVAASAMQAEGHTFYRTENGVWLTDAVPAHFLTLTETCPK